MFQKPETKISLLFVHKKFGTVLHQWKAGLGTPATFSGFFATVNKLLTIFKFSILTLLI